MFYSEFKIFGTSTPLTSMAAMAALAVGTKIQRTDGTVYEKNSKGAWLKIGVNAEYNNFVSEW